MSDDTVKPYTCEELEAVAAAALLGPFSGHNYTNRTVRRLLATALAGVRDTERLDETRAILKHGYSSQDFEKAVTYALSRIADAARGKE